MKNKTIGYTALWLWLFTIGISSLQTEEPAKNLSGSPEDENVRQAIAAIEQERGLKFKTGLNHKILPADNSQLQGLYNPETKILYVKKSANPTREYATVIHEAFHGLQDQHFDLIKLHKKARTTDESYTIKAVLEGDATYLTMACLPQSRMSRMLTVTPPWKQNKMSGQQLVSACLNTFDYSVGANFIKYIKESGDWKSVDKIYEQLPSSTEQLLHPDKYLKNKDEPVKITLPDFTGLFKGTWRAEKTDTLGEFALMLQLIQHGAGGPEAETAATGWDGDTLLMLRQEKETAEIWKTVWDTADDATEFFNLMQKIIKRQYPNIDPQETKENKTTFLLYPINQNLFISVSSDLQNKEVVFLNNLSKNNLLVTAKQLNLPLPEFETPK